MRRKRRELRQVPWVQGGGMILVENNYNDMSSYLEDIEISQISLSNQDADNCDCSRL